MNESNLYYNKKLKGLARKLRKESTKAEVKLWSEALRGKKMHGYSFLRQRPVLDYIADFMCKELMLIIELDGYSHGFDEMWKLDKIRQQKLEELGFTVLRFSDEEILNDLDNVMRSIEGWVLHHPPAPPSKGDQGNLNPNEGRS